MTVSQKLNIQIANALKDDLGRMCRMKNSDQIKLLGDTRREWLTDLYLQRDNFFQVNFKKCQGHLLNRI